MVTIPKRSAKIEEVVSFYLHSDAFARLKGSTQKQYEQHLAAALVTPVLGQKLGQYRAKSFRAKHANLAYSEWLRSGIRTANHRRAALSSAWKHSMRHDVMENDPIRLIKAVPDKQRKIKWTREQVKVFLDTAYSEYKWRSMGLIVHMAFEWAQRVGDMRELTWDQLDLDAQRIDLTQSKRGADVHLPISDDLTAILQQQKADLGFQPYVAPKPNAIDGEFKPYSINQISPVLNAIKSQAGLSGTITAMDLRRTAITEMVEAGVDLAGIMQVSGHNSPESVRPYLVNTFSGACNALAKRTSRNE